jgi:hypothetical protein
MHPIICRSVSVACSKRKIQVLKKIRKKIPILDLNPEGAGSAISGYDHQIWI